MNDVVSISEVKGTSVPRLSLGYDFEELDWLYGHSLWGNKLMYMDFWGIPIGSISNWIGEPGVGKSRLAIEVARKKVRSGSTVLYFQNEININTFAGWISKDEDLKNFYCCSASSLFRVIEVIKEIEPEVIFIDSINLIEEFGEGRDKPIRHIVEELREAIEGTNAYIIFLCQLNKDGSAKGSTALTHMPDINFLLTNEGDGKFRVSVGQKHRYGRTGAAFYSIWEHTDDGVKCISTNRFKDKKWCETCGVVFQKDPVDNYENKFEDLSPISQACILGKWPVDPVVIPEKPKTVKDRIKDRISSLFSRKK